MRWTETMTYEFVKIYGKYECLWNPSDPHYKTNYERDKAYNSMSQDFHNISHNLLTVLEIKRKVKNLRTTYMQQVNKILVKSTPDCTYEPTLFWFEAMDEILKNVSTNRHSETTKVHDSNNSVEVPTSSQIWADQNENTSLEELDDQVLIQQPNYALDHHNPDPLTTNSDEDECHDKIKDYDYYPTKNIKKKFKFKNKSHLKKRINLKKESKLEDEFDVYGRYIATQLRSMELPKALRVQLAIQNLVSKARISELSN